MSVRTDIEIREARDVRLSFTVEAEEGQSLQAAGTEISLWVARHPGSLAPELIKTNAEGDGIVVTGALTFNAEIEAVDTEGWSGKYYYEAMVRIADGNKVTAAHGYITVNESLIGGASE